MPRTPRNQDRCNTVKRFKDGAHRHEAICEVCGWYMPGGCNHMTEVHHVVMVSQGGTDDDSNLMWLCPNHHRLAHALFDASYRKFNTGPVTREAVIREIARFDREFTRKPGDIISEQLARVGRPDPFALCHEALTSHPLSLKG